MGLDFIPAGEAGRGNASRPTVCSKQKYLLEWSSVLHSKQESEESLVSQNLGFAWI
jgi:hypothetical protein